MLPRNATISLGLPPSFSHGSDCWCRLVKGREGEGLGYLNGAEKVDHRTFRLVSRG